VEAGNCDSAPWDDAEAMYEKGLREQTYLALG
jgi:hypothetical protein